MRGDEACVRDRRRLMRRLALGLLLATLSFPASATASLSWSAGTAIDHNGTQALTATSCPSSSQCTAVDRLGQEVTFNPQAPGAPTPVVLEPGAILTAIACPSTSQCTAATSGGSAVTFDPHSPSAATITPIRAQQQIQAISCPSVTQCTTLTSDGYAETFNPSAPGSPTPVQIDAARAGADVQCPSATQCVVLSNNLGGNSSSVASFDPTNPGTPTVNALSGIFLIRLSCSSGAQCVAVSPFGQAVKFAPSSPGSPTPITIDSAHEVNAVACPAALVCIAVDHGGAQVTFDPSSNAPTSPVSISAKALNALACPSVTQCTAVGDAGDAVTLDPISASTPTTTGVDTVNSLQRATCVSATQCTAVDDAGQEVTFNPFSPGATPAATGLIGALRGVACPSSTQCTAVDGSGHSRTFDPTALVSQTPATISGADPPVGALSCPAVHQCTIVDLSGFVTFNPGVLSSPAHVAITGGGSVWQGVACPSSTLCVAIDALGKWVTFDPTSNTSPTATGAPAGHLSAVSCVSTAVCIAVGDAGRVAVFDPATLVGPPAVTIDNGRSLTDVACTSATFCLAGDTVGNVVEGNPQTNTWVVEPLAGSDTVSAVSCVSSVQCVAVDSAGRMFHGLEAPSASSPPTITGEAAQGQALTEHHAGWSDNPTSYTYQWRRCDAHGASCAGIPGATTQILTLTAAQVGHTVRVAEVARNAGGPGTEVLSAPTVIVQGPLGTPANITRPRITGSANLGNKLSAASGTWSGGTPLSYRYQWQRCTVRCVNIAGRRSRVLTLGPADIGARIRVLVTATNPRGSAGAASTQTRAVTPTPGQIATSLRRAFVPRGDTATVAALLAIGGYHTSLGVSIAGKLTLGWYVLPPGAHLARTPKPVLVAVATATVRTPHRVSLKLRLTQKGQQLLRGALRLSLTGRGSLAVTHGPTVVARATFVVRR